MLIRRSVAAWSARRLGEWRGKAQTLYQRIPGLARSHGGAAAVEFAMILPVIVIFFIGMFDIAKATILYEQIYQAATTIAVTASNIAVQPDLTTSLTVNQVQQALSAIYAEIPWIRSGIETGQRSVTMSSISFVQTVPSCVPSPTVACAATPNVAWSVPYQNSNATGFTQVVRACGALQQTTPPAGSSSLTSLPTAGVINPDPILVIDIHYKYTPMFFRFITGPIDFWASSYWSVRSAAPSTTMAQQYTRYDIANQANGSGKCSGFK